MQASTEVWILSSAVIMLATVLGFAAKLVTQEVVKRLDNIIDELQALTKITTTQEERIRSLHDIVVSHTTLLGDHAGQLSDHSHRILRIELTKDQN